MGTQKGPKYVEPPVQNRPNVAAKKLPAWLPFSNMPNV